MPLPGYAASGYVQANLPRFNWYPPVTHADIENIENQILNIQSGNLPMTGINFRIKAGLFGLKNATTGLFNVPTTLGADGVQQVELSNGQA